ncbi:hypothetical protein BJ875DRAFT_540524 [Amylocarpus encephaloides]|uniref:Uncharacterized protein n=1 Tax=Amylocarpus encephaloides TaxID=45428 RepID=A0A9P7YQN2_9HELO|nr:hypothetical protein BJ875DRAFT_540524 [Amylocarpus encephaloides]
MDFFFFFIIIIIISISSHGARDRWRETRMPPQPEIAPFVSLASTSRAGGVRLRSRRVIGSSALRRRRLRRARQDRDRREPRARRRSGGAGCCTSGLGKREGVLEEQILTSVPNRSCPKAGWNGCVRAIYDAGCTGRACSGATTYDDGSSPHVNRGRPGGFQGRIGGWGMGGCRVRARRKW